MFCFHLPTGLSCYCYGIARKFLSVFLILLLNGSAAGAQDLLLGLASTGGTGSKGTAFSIKTTGADFKVDRSFFNMGIRPYGDLIRGKDGLYYGMTASGGTYNYGTIFKMTSGGAVTVLRNLNFADGTRPTGSLVQASDGYFYGMTNGGGDTSSYKDATIFRISSTGSFKVLRTLYYFTDGKPANDRLVQGADGYLYGTTSYGGEDEAGTIFKINLSGSDFQVIHHFYYNFEGGYPLSGLVEGADGNFYGTTRAGGGTGYDGTIYRVSPSGSFQTLVRLKKGTTNGDKPAGGLIRGSDGNFYGTTRFGGDITISPHGYGTIFKMTPGGALTTIARFNKDKNGAYPDGRLFRDANGNLFGMAAEGGTNGYGTVFRCSPTGTISVIRHLNGGSEGAYPHGGLCQDSDSNLIGMTSGAPTEDLYEDPMPSGNGTIFKINPTKFYFSVLVFLPDGQGANPQENLLLAKDGNYYGTTKNGGRYGAGTLFRLSPEGSYKLLYSFKAITNGGNPMGSLMQASDSNIYGTTTTGGTYDAGTIFRWDLTNSSYTVLYNPLKSWARLIQCRLVEGSNGKLYGTAMAGGTNDEGKLFSVTTTSPYTFTNYHSFSSVTDGKSPTGDLIQLSDGWFYGMTTYGGSAGYGTIFRFSLANFEVLKMLTSSSSHGMHPYGSLVKGTDGVLYGMTNAGGVNGGGILFKIDPTTKVFAKLYDFAAGTKPRGDLVLGSDGAFYGMTSAGGSYGGGTIFKFLNGQYTLLKSLNPAKEGSTPLGSLIIKKVTAGTTTLRINSGGSSATTSFGTFSADNYFTGTTGTFSTTADITNTTNDAIYREYRRAATAGTSFGYRIPVTNGSYTVKLHFAEIYATAAGQRKFNVIAEGTAWLTNYDVYVAAGGKNRAWVEPKNITVSDGYLDLSFVSVVDRACVSAIEVVPYNSSSAATVITAAPVPLQMLEEATLLSGTLYPNPVKDRLTVSLAGGVEQARVTITNALGINIRNQAVRLNGKRTWEMNVATLQTGVYYLNVQTDTGNQTFRFIKD